MFLQIFIAAFAIAIVIFWYTFYLVPKRNIKRYKDQFQKLGYKPYILDFKPFQFSVFQLGQKGNEKGDYFHYYKHDLQGYDLVIGNTLNNVLIQLLSPQLIKQFFQQERLYNYQKDQFSMKIFNRISGIGVVSSERDVWKNKRKCLNTIFNFNFIANQTDTIKKFVQQCFDKVNQNIKQDGTLEFSIKQLSISLTSKITFNAFLGGNLNAQRINDESPTNLLRIIISQNMEYYSDIIAMVLGPKFIDKNWRQKDRVRNKRLQIFNSWANNYIENRIKYQKQRVELQQQKYQPSDIISALNYVHFVNKTQEYSVQDITSQLKTFFIAGNKLEFNYVYDIFCLLKPNSINEKMTSDEIIFDQIKNMKYIDAIQNQTIRVMGPINTMFLRKATQDHYLGGAKIYKGTSMKYFSHTIHFSQKQYKQPFQWRPQRWINGQCRSNHPFSLIGFHGGSRSCLGKHIALLETKIFLIMFIKKYKNVKIDCKKLQLEMGLIFWPKDYRITAQI